MSKLKKRLAAGADDIYLTKNSIAVRKVRTVRGKSGITRLEDSTRYFPKTEQNIKNATSIFGRLRIGRKGV